ncbi:MAG TPA: tetrahydrofolate dehydrogenase/cyclohydrolase catalytic domain-containing protein [Acidimicrobiales bacterium]|nr:tetrahydrofolate dehydrogenase/cyclohydrolase catalytic domain-containing protein [Acidimicrobiales bacterium]
MPAIVMAGAPVAEAVLGDVSKMVSELAEQGTRVGLGTILVGDDPASAHYVARKHETCERYGIRSVDIRIPASATQADLLAAVDQLNEDPSIDGFLIQNPVPAGFDYNEALARVLPAKDSDGLHPVNLGYLALGEPGHPRPCTPVGVVALMRHYGVPVEGRNVVVVGRGPTLGRPLGLLLSLKEPGANAAVTVVHTGVKDWAEYTRRADIVVGAAGVPNMITPEVIAPGSCVVGGGISWEGKKLLSDVDEGCAEVAGWVTPRLGGVGVTTVALLLFNTVAAAKRRARA